MKQNEWVVVSRQKENQKLQIEIEKIAESKIQIVNFIPVCPTRSNIPLKV